jgi:prepilin-type N-terminal cleavage/methylation domain-containing protein
MKRMLRLHKKRSVSGFTIVELSVVIAVLGILAGIAIISYGAWRANVASKELKSDLTGMRTAMESERNFGSGYPLSLPSTFTASTNVTLTYYSGTATAYCINGVSKADSSVKYFIDSVRTGGEPKKGTCVTGEVP